MILMYLHFPAHSLKGLAVTSAVAIKVERDGLRRTARWSEENMLQ